MGQKLLFLGDLFYDYDFIAEDIEVLSEWIKANQFMTILNLEGSIKSECGKAIKKRGPNLASSPVVIDVLKKLNVVGVCLANNHIMDFGEDGLKHTIQVLDNYQIQHTGAGSSLSQALYPIVLQTEENKKISILNFGWDIEETVYVTDTKGGCAPRDKKIILSAIEKLKQNSDQIIVCLHWGFEYNRLPMPYDIDLAHEMIKSGVHMVIGHHPHCVQPKEIFMEKHIYYSLGNFYFASRRNSFKKRFHEKIENQSDYGLMVSYETDSEECFEYLIKYDCQRNWSEVFSCMDTQILECISMGDSNLDWRRYIKKVKKRKQNINPVLTTDEKKNRYKLQKLFYRYKVKAWLKNMLKGK